MTQILGIVPARAGSKGIPLKNLLTLGGKTLLELAVLSSLASKLITRTIVSTESERLAEVGRAAGADIPFMRPDELASDTASTWSVVKHAVNTLDDQGFRADLVVVLQPTTPFRTGAHIDEVIQAVLDSDALTALSTREVDYPPQWMFRVDDHKRIHKLIDGPPLTRRQDAIPIYQPSGLVYAARREALMRDPVMPGPDTLAVAVSQEDAVNIDAMWQYRLAEYMWEERFGKNP